MAIEDMLRFIQDPESFKAELNVVQQRLVEAALDMYMMGATDDRTLVIEYLERVKDNDVRIDLVIEAIREGDHIPLGSAYKHLARKLEKSDASSDGTTAGSGKGHNAGQDVEDTPQTDGQDAEVSAVAPE